MADKFASEGKKKVMMEGVQMTEARCVFETGATRSGDADLHRFEQICPTALRHLAARYGLGMQIHGEANWTTGLPIADTLNHVDNHLNLYRIGNTQDDHLAAAMWGIATLIHYESGCRCQDYLHHSSQLFESYIARLNIGGTIGIGGQNAGQHNDPNHPRGYADRDRT